MTCSPDDLRIALVVRFNERIGARDLDGLVELMSEGHTFIDSSGAAFTGRAVVQNAWRGFFSSFPDYRNVFERFACKGDVVAVLGHSVCSAEFLQGPCIWTVKFSNDKISEWRVYDDTPESRRTLSLDDF